MDNQINKVNSSDVSDYQKQTADCFSYKWSVESSYESETVKGQAKKWLFERYCGNNINLLDKWFAGKDKSILDAGCGAGFSAELLFGDFLKNHYYIGVDISSAVKIAEKRISKVCRHVKVIQSDLNSLDLPEQSVDIIFSEGVLHHTDNTEASLNHLVLMLKPGGRIMFYVYKKKAPVREYTDDYIREKLQPLSDEEAWNMLIPLTKLGKALGKLNQEIEIEEDIPLLGIKKGKHDLQRLIYWNICKLYYREDYSLEEMNHINFDWFRPLNCHRHTEDEVKNWCEDLDLNIEHINVQDSGITVVAIKEDK